MRVLAGTSGFSYKEWKGSFYPEDLPADRMLAYYSERLPAVEINNTFYRMPKPALLESWAAEVAPEFRFVLKASQRITHFKRLKDTGSDVEYFFGVASTLGERLGPVLVQLPPNLKKDLPRLEAFLATLPAGARAAFEFRHASWFEEDVFEALRGKGAALCVAEDEELATPLVATAPWGYLRLRRQDYDGAAVAAWADRVRAQSWSEAYVFFKHEDAGAGPRLASQFLERFRS
jgi:uncharacterized protein YecE (DUF72 family)